jgi:hypothetical protein
MTFGFWRRRDKDLEDCGRVAARPPCGVDQSD